MKALRKLVADEARLSLEDVAPASLPPGHVRVAVAACGVCGTDLHIRDGGYASSTPVTLGHEVGGTVDELGAGVEGSWLGAQVALETFYSVCGTCDFCRDGRPNLCRQRKSIGSGVDGGFAESVVVPASNLHLLPQGLDPRFGALCEPLACVCQSLLDPARVQSGDRVLITGPGAMGLLAGQVAASLGGAVTLAGTPSDTERLSVGTSLGMTAALSSELGGEFDVVIDCSGAGPAMALGLEMLRPGGRYVQIGQTDRAVSVRLALLSFKELELSGGFASTPRSWRRAITLLEDGAVRFEPIVTEIAPLDEWERVFARTESADGVKFLLAPTQGLSA
jgi:L-iditol 2-dehydrogenase